jgi:hypothetical protein
MLNSFDTNSFYRDYALLMDLFGFNLNIWIWIIHETRPRIRLLPLKFCYSHFKEFPIADWNMKSVKLQTALPSSFCFVLNFPYLLLSILCNRTSWETSTKYILDGWGITLLGCWRSLWHRVDAHSSMRRRDGYVDICSRAFVFEQFEWPVCFLDVPFFITKINWR